MDEKNDFTGVLVRDDAGKIDDPKERLILDESDSSLSGKEEQIMLNYLENHLTGNGFDENLHQISDNRVAELISIQDEMKEFRYLMMCYECAMIEVRTKLDVLNNQLTVRDNRNPIESIKSRIKTPSSIYDKIKGRSLEFNMKNIETQLDDIAGVRVICSFVDDIFRLRDALIKQDDISLIKQKDYINNPKRNGYRSLHLILGVPIFLMNEKKIMHVEVQFRTGHRSSIR